MSNLERHIGRKTCKRLASAILCTFALQSEPCLLSAFGRTRRGGTQKVAHTGQVIPHGGDYPALTDGAKAVLQQEREALEGMGIHVLEQREGPHQVVLYEHDLFNLIEKARLWSLPESPAKVPVLNWMGAEAVLTVRTENPQHADKVYLVRRDTDGTFELEGSKKGRIYRKIVYRDNPLKGSFSFLGKAIRAVDDDAAAKADGWVVTSFLGDRYLLGDGKLAKPDRYQKEVGDFGNSRLYAVPGSPGQFVLQSKRFPEKFSKKFIGAPQAFDKNTLLAKAPNGFDFFISRKSIPNSSYQFRSELGINDIGEAWVVSVGHNFFLIGKRELDQSDEFHELIQDFGDDVLVRRNFDGDEYAFMRKQYPRFSPGWDGIPHVYGKPESMQDAWVFGSGNSVTFMRHKTNNSQSPLLSTRPDDFGLSWLAKHNASRNQLFQKTNYHIVTPDFSGNPRNYGRTWLLAPWPAPKENYRQLPMMHLVRKERVNESRGFHTILEGKRTALNDLLKRPYRLWLKVLTEEDKKDKTYWVNTMTLAVRKQAPLEPDVTYDQ